MANVDTPASTGISSPSDSLIIASPVLSASSLSSSFDFVAAQQQSNSEHCAPLVIHATPIDVNAVVLTGEESSFSDGDDEIVWSVSESEDFEGIHGGAVLSDDDFVVLNRAPRQSVSSPRPMAGAATTASQTGTVRGAPRETGPELDATLEAEDAGGAKTTRAVGSAGVVAAELAKELARLNIDAEPIGESGGTKTLEAGPSATGNAKKKAKKPKKERTEEEERLRQQRKKERKEKKKQEKAAEKALRKEKALVKELKKEAKAAEKEAAKVKEEKSKQVANDVAAVSTANEGPMSPIMTPGLAKSISSATLVPSSSTLDSSDSAPTSETERRAFAPPSGVQQLLSTSSSQNLKTPTVTPKTLEPTKKKTRRKNKAAAALTSPVSVTVTGNDGTNNGLSAQHNVVIAEKVSEQTTNQDTPPAAYDEAVNYITSYISNPIAHHDRVCHLTLLQSFIIELGLLTDLTLLPRSIKSAKTFVKSRVFLNIKDYLSKRHECQDKIKELMLPSRSALVRDMRRKKNYASLKWVKKQGLQDLLVSAFHRS